MKPVKYRPYKSNLKLKFENDMGCFASEKEAERYRILADMERNGKISDLQCHVNFELLEPVYHVKREKKALKTKTKTIKKNVCVEQGVTMDASFIYLNPKGKLRVEVVKRKRDYKDPAYIIKRKLMRYLHNIVVIEN